MSGEPTNSSDDEDLPPIDEWMVGQDIESTAEIEIPSSLVEQVIGQDESVVVIKKAAEQKRHVMLIGDPGTGKSMLANSMVELLSKEELQDILVYHNPDDPNEPRIRVVPAGKGKEIVGAQKAEAMQRREQKASLMMTIMFIIVGLAVMLSIRYDSESGAISFDPTPLMIGILIAVIVFMFSRYSGRRQEAMMIPKLLVSHDPDDLPPFIDATGSHAGALLGDVKHDPFQSGGLETPSHDRVDAGAIHRAHKGVLFLDEINMLRLESQQSLLTALQEKKFSIVGQSERSSGAMVKTEAVPCDFILVAAGNLDAVSGMQRLRLRGLHEEHHERHAQQQSEAHQIRSARSVQRQEDPSLR